MNEITIQMLDKGMVKVTLDDPERPVNTMTLELLREFQEKILPLISDDAVKGMVFCSTKPDTFIAGADIKLFAQADDPDLVCQADRAYSRVLTGLSRGNKPLVAAVHGAALGGGLEVVLACHYIVASRHPATVLGLPEVQLGILPAAGGTQRLPKRVGLIKGLDMMLTGKRVRSGKALRLGLVDEVTAPEDLFETAVGRLNGLIEGRIKLPLPKTTLAEGIIRLPLIRDIFFRKVRQQVLGKTRGNYPGPLKIVECVELGVKEGEDKALEREISYIGPLLMTSQSRSLMWLFLANQEMKSTSLSSSRAIKKVGILGAGTIGTGIASATLDRYPVAVYDTSESALEGCQKRIRSGLLKRLKSEAITQEILEERLGGFTGTGLMGDLSGADLLIEAVANDPDLKGKTLAEIEKYVNPETVIATNTVFVPVSRIAKDIRHRERVVGVRYFAPVHKVPVAELIAPDGAADWALGTVQNFLHDQGKTVICVKDTPGFFTTKVLCRYLMEALMLLEEGHEIDRIDRIMKDFGYASGPMAIMDEMGLETVSRLGRFMAHTMKERFPEPSNTLSLLMEAGLTGQKNGRGFYLYSKGKKGRKAPNRKIYGAIPGTGRAVTYGEEIRDRLVLSTVNEAARCLETQVIASPRDGDVGSVLGLGFPPFRGGPFHYADHLGATRVLNRLEHLRGAFGPRFAPAEILKDMAKREERFFP